MRAFWLIMLLGVPLAAQAEGQPVRPLKPDPAAEWYCHSQTHCSGTEPCFGSDMGFVIKPDAGDGVIIAEQDFQQSQVELPLRLSAEGAARGYAGGSGHTAQYMLMLNGDGSFFMTLQDSDPPEVASELGTCRKEPW
jgi:hypothetical protein